MAASQIFPRIVFYLILFLNLSDAFAKPTYEIAVVQSRALKPYEQAAQGIQLQLKEDGLDAHLEFYNIEGTLEKGIAVAGKIEGKGSNLVFTLGTEAFQAISGRLNKTPVVTAMLVDPEAENLIQDEAHVYGAYLRVPFEKQFRLLKKIVPDLQPIALIYIKNQKVNIAGAEEAGRKTGVSLALIEIESVRELEDALEKATLRAKALLLILNNDLYNSATSKELLLFSARNKFPIIAFTPNYVRAGALLSFSSDFSENGRSAAKLGALILKNEPVVEKFIPTEKAWVAWNESVAKAFGINLAKSGEDEIHEYL